MTQPHRSLNLESSTLHNQTLQLPPERPLVSIIVPCFNAYSFVAKAIDSVLSQSYGPIEVIVIDDGSTDDSLAVIQRHAAQYPDLIRYETGPNRGAPAARNRGLELARGEFIKFLDADDVLLPDCLARQIAQVQTLQLTERAIVYGDAIWIDHDDNLLPGYPHQPRKEKEDPIAHILANSPLTSCPLHRRTYLEEVKGFDTNVYGPDEYDLHLRLVLAGVNFVYHPGAVYRYRQHRTTQRITDQMYSHEGAMGQFNIINTHKTILESKVGRPLPPGIRQVLARRLWAAGRAVLRAGEPTAAAHYFAAARQLSPHDCIVGNPPYPTLVKLFGPRLAETSQDWLRTSVERFRTVTRSQAPDS